MFIFSSRKHSCVNRAVSWCVAMMQNISRLFQDTPLDEDNLEHSSSTKRSLSYGMKNHGHKETVKVEKGYEQHLPYGISVNRFFHCTGS